jgi:nicotinamidase-related amidase
MTADLLPHGPLTASTLHLCVDMQNLFGEETPWHTPWLKRVLPVVTELVERHPDRTIFTRFIPPAEPDAMPRAWRKYWERWRELTTSRINPSLLDLVPPLNRYVPPASVLDKSFYSPFHGTDLAQTLLARGIDTLIISGAETDMCVLAAVLDAVDLGMRVVLPEDALCSSADETHEALLTLYRKRFGQQIETASADTILACWL